MYDIRTYTFMVPDEPKVPFFGSLRLCHGYSLRSPWPWLRPRAPFAMDGSRHGSSILRSQQWAMNHVLPDPERCVIHHGDFMRFHEIS